MKCGSTENLTLFSINRGGIFCRDCAPEIQGIPIVDATRYTLQFIVSTPIEKLYTFTVSDLVLSQLKQIMRDYMSRYVHHEFKSLSVFASAYRNNNG
jgi:DNA repair protein RecO (recombination protein O)